MYSVRRLLIVALASAVGSAALADCMTREPMDATEMACCAAVDHDCGPAGVDEGCCSTEARRTDQQSPSAAPRVHPVPMVTSGLPAWVPLLTRYAERSAFEAYDREILRLPERPTYLLVSTFLI